MITYWKDSYGKTLLSDCLEFFAALSFFFNNESIYDTEGTILFFVFSFSIQLIEYYFLWIKKWYQCYQKNVHHRWYNVPYNVFVLWMKAFLDLRKIAFAVRNNYSLCRRMRSCQRKRNHSNDDKILRVYMILWLYIRINIYILS